MTASRDAPTRSRPAWRALIASELAYLEAQLARKTCQHGVIHADLFPDNVFFLGDRCPA